MLGQRRAGNWRFYKMNGTLTINGAVNSESQLSYEDLSTRADLKPDVNVDLSGKAASGIPFVTLLKLTGIQPTATHVTLHAEHDSFAASVPLSAVQDAVVIFEINGSPIGVDKGGPFRFYIPNAGECSIDEVDECANVKYLDRIELTIGPGKDTRPRTKKAHKDLHETESVK
jgi:2-dehydropantoate 2-reductase